MTKKGSILPFKRKAKGNEVVLEAHVKTVLEPGDYEVWRCSCDSFFCIITTSGVKCAKCCRNVAELELL